MSGFINGFYPNFGNKVYSLNKSQNGQPSKCSNRTADTREVGELAKTSNGINVRVPLSYVKLGEKDFPYGLKAYFYKLSNGQKIVVLPKEGKTVIRSYVNTGSLNEPDNIRGISHYIEHNLFNGSEGLDAGEFFKTADKIGADTNASTGLAETNYYIASNLLNDTDLEEEMRIHSSMLESPKFALDMLEKEKGIVNSEINMITSNPENIAYNKTIKTLFNINTTSNDVIAGTTDNITNLTREDVVNYYGNNYYPANIVTVISGEVEPENTMKLVSKYFNSSKQPPKDRHFENLVPIDKTKRQDIISDKTQSSYVVMGFAGPENNNLKDRIYSQALFNLMFQSGDAGEVFRPLNAMVMKKKEKILSKANAPKALMVVANSSEENSEKVLKTLYSRIQKYQNTPVSADDLATLKRNMKKSFTDMFESSFEINNFIGTSMLENCVDDINNYEKIIDTMSPADLQNAARKYFDLNKTAITVLHPSLTNDVQIQKNYNNANGIAFTGAIEKKAVNTDNIRQYQLPNNYRVAINESRFPNVHSELMLRVENPIISKNPAAYYVLNEIFLNGSMNLPRDEFNKQSEKLGATIALTADECGLCGLLYSDSEDYSNSQKLFNDVLLNPRFTQETFDDAVRDVKDIIIRSEKSPWNKLLPELYPNDYTKEQILESLNTLSLEDVKELYNELMKNSHGVVSVSAPVNNNINLKNSIFNSVASLPVVRPYKNVLREDYAPVERTKVLTDVDSKNQARIVMSYKFRATGNIKDKAALELMNHILGGGPSSRLFDDLREKQKLAYTVRSKVNRENTTGVISLSIGTTTDNKETGEKSYDNLQKSINGFKTNIDRITKEKVSEEELAKAKLAIKNQILSNNESTLGKTSSIMKGASNWYGISYYNDLLKTLDTITIDDIYNTANYVFKGRPVYSIVTTQDTLDYNKDYLESLVG